VQEKHFKNVGGVFWRSTSKIGINLHCELGIHFAHFKLFTEFGSLSEMCICHTYGCMDVISFDVRPYVLMNFARKGKWIKNGRTIFRLLEKLNSPENPVK